MKRQVVCVLVALSHPRVMLLLGTVFAVGTAVQLWWRGAFLLAGLFLVAFLGAAVTGWGLYHRGQW